jgi:hypothetical protein
MHRARLQRRRATPANCVPQGRPDALTIAAYVDAASGLPLREETLDPQGQVQWVMEYFDHNAAIEIDPPPCIK